MLLCNTEMKLKKDNMLRLWQDGMGVKFFVENFLLQVQGSTMFSEYTVYIFRGIVSVNKQPVSSLPGRNSWDGILNRFDSVISGRFASSTAQ